METHKKTRFLVEANHSVFIGYKLFIKKNAEIENRIKFK